jgi:hypothetical protein
MTGMTKMTKIGTLQLLDTLSDKELEHLKHKILNEFGLVIHSPNISLEKMMK